MFPGMCYNWLRMLLLLTLLQCCGCAAGAFPSSGCQQRAPGGAGAWLQAVPPGGAVPSPGGQQQEQQHGLVRSDGCSSVGWQHALLRPGASGMQAAVGHCMGLPNPNVNLGGERAAPGLPLPRAASSSSLSSGPEWDQWELPRHACS